MKKFVTMKGFTQNKQVRNVFRKTKFKDFMKGEKEYKEMIMTNSKETAAVGIAPKKKEGKKKVKKRIT